MAVEDLEVLVVLYQAVLGGNSFFGGGAPGPLDGNGFAGTSGGGGSGGSSDNNFTSKAGGAGGAGLIRIWEFS